MEEEVTGVEVEVVKAVVTAVDGAGMAAGEVGEGGGIDGDEELEGARDTVEEAGISLTGLASRRGGRGLASKSRACTVSMADNSCPRP